MAELAEMTKQDVLDLVGGMPDDASLDDIIYALYVRAMIDRGTADSKAGRLVSHEEVMKQMDDWLRSAGQ